MKILHICNISDRKDSGMSVVIPQHLNAQSQLEQIICINFSNTNFILNDDVKYYYLDGFHRNKIKYIIKKIGKVDIVIFHGMYLPDLWKMWYFYAKKQNIPYIVVPHGSSTNFAQRKSKFKKKLANIVCVNSYMKNSQAIHFLSYQEMNETKKRWRGQYFIVGNGIYPAPKEEYQSCNKSSIDLVYIGRLDIYHKGLDILLEACKKIDDYLRTNIVKIYLYGSDVCGDKEKLVDMITKLEINDIVKVCNPIYEEEKRRILTNTDYFIQTSRFEGMPMGILEALSYGIPVIVSEGTGMADLVLNYKCGWVGNNSIDISKAIIKAIDSMKEKNLYKENALKCAKLFFWDSIAKETISHYKKILNR